MSKETETPIEDQLPPMEVKITNHQEPPKIQPTYFDTIEDNNYNEEPLTDEEITKIEEEKNA